MFSLIILFYSNKNSSKNEKNKEIVKKTFKCQRQLSDSVDNIETYQVEDFIIDEDVILSSKSTMKLVFSDKSLYELMISDEEYIKEKSVDDKTMTISFKNAEDRDYTIDIDNKKNEVLFSEYSAELETIGYSCEKNQK